MAIGIFCPACLEPKTNFYYEISLLKYKKKKKKKNKKKKEKKRKERN
jgi:hypothetical protein